MNVKTSSYVIVDTFKMLNSYMEHVATVLDNSDTEHFHTTESSTRQLWSKHVMIIQFSP